MSLSTMMDLMLSSDLRSTDNFTFGKENEAETRMIKKFIDVESKKKVKMFRKSEYFDIVKSEREKFVLEHFEKDVKYFSEKLREDAMDMQPCNAMLTFCVKEIFDASKVEIILQEYFRDCGYTVTSKRTNSNIEITLS